MEKILLKYFSEFHVGRLIICASMIQRVEVAKCNRPLRDYEAGQQERAECEIIGICSRAIRGPVTSDFSGDPRGYVVKLLLPDGEYNTMGGPEAGYGIG